MAARLYRFRVDGRPRHVVEQEDRFQLVEGDPFGDWRPGLAIEVDAMRPLAPVDPGKIIGIGRNYRAHAAERDKPVPREPLVFLKPPSAVIGPGAPIVLPPAVGRVDHEAELAVVIGRRATRVRAEEALEVVFGLTCINDVTARDLQDQGFQFSHVKGYDSFAPLGPCVLLERNAAGRLVEGLVNGEIRQRSTTDHLIFTVPELIAYVSAIMTLMPGDVIATGTPAGIGSLVAGDIVTVRVEGVGELVNPVVEYSDEGKGSCRR
jgi:2-keto-4-pentenoate hydratase/2-oxohepta-3-ene-1,7-dioic acid hydratase in catechol pathway